MKYVQNIRLAPASEVDIGQLTLLLNQAYSDYALPVWFSGERFAQMCLIVDVTLAHSVVALAEEQPVGLALLSRRERRGWISSVGVLPLFRRQGIAQQMLAYLLEEARALQLEQLTLEVLTRNAAGMALYQAAGFREQREILWLGRRVFVNEAVPTFPLDVQVASAEGFLAYHEAFHAAGPALPWQRELPSLRRRLPWLRGLGVWSEGQLRGYLLYEEHRYSRIVHDLALDPAAPQRTSAASRLLRALHSLSPQLPSYAVDLVSEDPLVAVFEAAGYSFLHSQKELVHVPVGDG